MKHRRYYQELTVMSGIAILFVLAIHGCGDALRSFHPGDADYINCFWLRTLRNLTAPAVPIFLFVAGFKYSANDKETSLLVFFKKRLPRVLMSFFIFNTLFWALDSIKYMESFDVILLAKTYMHSWVGYSVAYQLWYIPMYCCVVALCPLVGKKIPSTISRFCIFAAVGIIQRVLEISIPLLSTYPIRFLSYPVFFELGVLVQEWDLRNKISKSASAIWGSAYALLVIIVSWFLPAFSANELTKYLVFYFGGTVAVFVVSLALQQSRVLRWLGAISYPIFLLHEPILGSCCTLALDRMNMHTEVVWLLIWIILDLAASALAVYLIKMIHLDRVLWNFRLQDNIATKE